MQAVILAGGLATRMLPHTQTLPKSLLRVAGRAFIDWQLERLAQCELRDVVLCIGHLGRKIREHVGDGGLFGVRVRYVEDGPKLLGTAGALRQALSELETEFLVTYGDSYLPFDYRAPLADLQAHSAARGTLAVFHNQGRWDRSNVRVSGSLVTAYDKAATDPSFDHIDYGALALRREVVEALPSDRPIELSLLQTQLAASGELRALIATQRFYEVGSERGLQELEQYLA